MFKDTKCTSFAVGDKVKCSAFLYTIDYKYKGTVGVFIKYNKYGDYISYIYFGQPSEAVSCFTSGLEKLIQKGQQLEFSFMEE